MPLVLLLALLLSVSDTTALSDSASSPAPSPAVADTTDEGIDVGLRIIPSGFYSPSKGFGAGGGVALGNLVAPGTELVLTAQVMQRFRRYRASLFTSDPFRTPLFVGVTGEYVGTSVRSFYGLGPQSREASKVYVDLQEVEAEFRLGWYPFNTGPLLIQPVVRLLHTHVHSFRDRRENAVLTLDARSQRSLFEAVERPTTGVTYGLEVALDGRDRLLYSTRGALLLLTARRYDGLGDRPFRYYASTASFYGFVPLPPHRHVLFSRAIVALTRRIGDEPIPFYALPVLDDDLIGAYPGHRFNGHDLLVITAGYRFPLLTLYDWFALDAHVAVSAANAYDNLFEQFEPGIAFDTDLTDEGGRTRLRPSLTIGGRLVNLDRDRVIVGGQIGVGPEGVRFASLRLVYGIRDVRPLVR
jgi:hypothetical protein